MRSRYFAPRRRSSQVFYVVRANGDYLSNMETVPWQWSPRLRLAFKKREDAAKVVRERMFGSAGVRVVPS